tara:strand:- start:308 stop:493 length:186 start_codon:yes stop_codon:yes gene_type:complete
MSQILKIIKLHRIFLEKGREFHHHQSGSNEIISEIFCQMETLIKIPNFSHITEMLAGLSHR